MSKHDARSKARAEAQAAADEAARRKVIAETEPAPPEPDQGDDLGRDLASLIGRSDDDEIDAMERAMKEALNG